MGRVGRALLRRQGAFSPAEVPSLVGWFKADGDLFQDSARTTPAIADGDLVGSWTDLSSGAKHASQATSTKRPTLKTNIINGKPAVRFDDVDDYLITASPISTSTINATLFVVAASPAASGGPWFNTGSGASNNGWSLGYGSGTYDTNGLDVIALKDGVAWVPSGSLTVTAATFTILAAAVQADSKIKQWKSGGAGVLPADAASIIEATIGSTIGGNEAAGRYSKADIAEVIFYNALLLAADMDRVGGYLAAKYGATWAASS